MDSNYQPLASDASLPFWNTSLGATARTADFVSRLTPQEAIGLMRSGSPGVSRLSAPGMPTGEALHGVVAKCTKPIGNGRHQHPLCPTSFPSMLSVGATFNKTLFGEIHRRFRLRRDGEQRRVAVQSGSAR